MKPMPSLKLKPLLIHTPERSSESSQLREWIKGEKTGGGAGQVVERAIWKTSI
jgi:hypothetical protein